MLEDVPTKYAACVWNRVLHLDELGAARGGAFSTRNGQLVTDGHSAAPPEPRRPAPPASPSAGG